MTALSDAAQAVEYAAAGVRRELEKPTEWVTGEVGASAEDATRLVDKLIAAVRHHDAEVVRADAGHIRYGSATEYAERHANLISPAADAPPEVEVRYAGGPTIRIAGFTVKTDAGTGLVVVEGFITSRTGQPLPGDAVSLAYLGIPGRGALMDIEARVELFTRLDVLNIRIRTTIRPEATS